MNGKAFFIATMAGCCLTGSLCRAQDGGFPYLTALGRWAGVGYTKGGYHAPSNGQLPVVKRHHPAQSYSSWRLMYPYHPGYQPFRVSHPSQNSLGAQPLDGVPTPAPEQPETVEPEKSEPEKTEPEKFEPREPPPEWLRKYLDGQESQEPRGSGNAGRSSNPELKVPNPIPSPNSNEELPTPSANPNNSPASDRSSPFRFDDDLQPSPSDRLRDNKSAPGEDNGLLLLDPDDLSYRSRSGVNASPRPTLNRYRQVSGARMIRQPHFAPVSNQRQF